VLGWSVDTSDYLRPDPAVLVARVLAAAQPGGIVLMHDGGGDRSHTVAALPAIIAQLEARGYTLVTPPVSPG
jgi:peptidoglycan-N-acetylglucosamine deacetylase